MADRETDTFERFTGVSRDLYIEIFGVLVPGFFFLLLTFFALVIPLEYLLGVLDDLHYTPLISAFIADHAVISFIISLFAAYVAGHIFYRSDPKNPDFWSIRQLPEKVRESGCVRTVRDEFPAHTRERYNGSEEYPYGHLYEYLNDRGFDELKQYILWAGDDFQPDADEAALLRRQRRTKHLINRMKLAVKSHDKVLFFEITRNEAHIRLMSSLWYLSWYVLGAAVVGIAIAIGTMIIVPWSRDVALESLPQGKFEAALFPLASGLVAASLLWSIGRFFHYQRVREIVFVLEALHNTKSGGASAFPTRPSVLSS